MHVYVRQIFFKNPLNRLVTDVPHTIQLMIKVLFLVLFSSQHAVRVKKNN